MKVLAKISVNVAIKNSTVTRKFTVCFNEEDRDATALDIHVAGDEVKHCQGIADGNGAHNSIITPANDVTLKFVSLSESLVNLVQVLINKN
nr:hypothetical protein [Tanacetum cinerariifolium]